MLDRVSEDEPKHRSDEEILDSADRAFRWLEERKHRREEATLRELRHDLEETDMQQQQARTADGRYARQGQPAKAGKQPKKGKGGRPPATRNQPRRR
jgi:hypothetical protein